MPYHKTPPPIEQLRRKSDAKYITIITDAGGASVCIDESLLQHYSDLELADILQAYRPYATAANIAEELAYYSSRAEPKKSETAAAAYERIPEDIQDWLGKSARQNYMACKGFPVSKGSSINASKKKQPEAYVYLISTQQGHYKIGYSRDPDERMNEFNISPPYKLNKVTQFWCDDANKAESTLHSWLDARRLNGEWFDLDNKQVMAICKVQEYKNSHFLDEDGDIYTPQLLEKLTVK